MRAFVEKLKEYLKDNKENYLEINDWCGDTVSGFYTETHFDMDKLWAEIDDFCERFNKGAE